jgi:hypothetical protein
MVNWGDGTGNTSAKPLGPGTTNLAAEGHTYSTAGVYDLKFIVRLARGANIKTSGPFLIITSGSSDSSNGDTTLIYD